MVIYDKVKILDNLKSIGSNMLDQGKTKEQVVQAFGVYLKEAKKNIDPEDLD